MRLPLHWRTELYLYIPRLPTHFLETMHVSVKKLAMALPYYCHTREYICVCLYIGVRCYICISLGYEHIFLESMHVSTKKMAMALPYYWHTHTEKLEF